MARGEPRGRRQRPPPRTTVGPLGPRHGPEVCRIPARGIDPESVAVEHEPPTWEVFDAGHLRACRWVAVEDDEVLGWAALAPASSGDGEGGPAEVRIGIAPSSAGRDVRQLLLRTLAHSSEAAGIEVAEARTAPVPHATGQAAPPLLPAALLDFAEIFNRGGYWESHELLEGPWRASGSRFYRGLILHASAFVHLERGNAHGVSAQLRKAERALAPFAPFYLGVEVDALLAEGRALRDALALEATTPLEGSGEEQDRSSREKKAGPPRPIHPDPTRVRGDEPERIQAQTSLRAAIWTGSHTGEKGGA